MGVSQLTLGADAFEQHGCRFVCGVLGDELAGESMLQNGLAKTCCATKLEEKSALQVVDLC
jgi:hypothetical protein